jgi:preprotein translocase subunit YajC
MHNNQWSDLGLIVTILLFFVGFLYLIVDTCREDLEAMWEEYESFKKGRWR